MMTASLSQHNGSSILALLAVQPWNDFFDQPVATGPASKVTAIVPWHSDGA